GPVHALPALFFAGLLIARWLLWRAWRARLEGKAAPRALAQIDRVGPALQGLAPVALLLLAWAASGAGASAASAAALAAAGLLAAVPGAVFKFVLITRAGFNQGFVLARLPVRGVPR
ncbi:MAG TPA: hypothetical protein VJ743_00935, partial [Albitalea sp.]|nr:hypothetical protein [Albitalea sp.]